MKHLLKFLLLAALSTATLAPAANKEEEARLIAVIKAEGDLKARFDACRELGRMGTADAVPALASLLADEKLSHMARFGLEAIPGPEVDAALRTALGTLKGDQLIGVVNSLGVRRDAKAVGALAELLRGTDASVAFAAGAALGLIATAEAGDILAQQLQEHPALAGDGCLRFADATLRAGRTKESVKMYDALKQSKAAEHIRLAAMRGAIVARGKDGLQLFQEGLADTRYGPFIMALGALPDLPGSKFTKATTDALPTLPAERRPAVMGALGARGDRSAVPELLNHAKAGAPELRIAAIKAIARIGDNAAFASLLQLASDADTNVAQTAQNGIASFAGKEADNAVLDLLKSDDLAQRKLGIELIYQRRISSAIPKLLRTASDADASIRLASIEALGRLAGEEEFGPLLGILQRVQDPAELKAAEKALSATCNRLSTPSATKVVIQKADYGDLPDGPQADVTGKIRGMVKMGTMEIEVSNSNFGDPAGGKVKRLRVAYTVGGKKHNVLVNEGQTITLASSILPDNIAQKIAEAFSLSKGEARTALLRLMSRNADDRSLAALREALKTGDAAGKADISRALCNWASPAALPDLQTLMKSGDDTIRALAFRGAIRLAPEQDLPPAKRAATLSDLFTAAGNDADRKLVLAALAEVPCAESFKLAADQLAQPALKEEAALAAVSVAENLKGPALAAAKPVLRELAKDAGTDTGKRAAAVLK